MWDIEQQAKRVEQVTCEVMFRATKSAIQLRNFPLNACDVQCAFDSAVRIHSDIDATMESMIRENLALLGYTF